MKVAISTDGDFVSAHFGRCPSYTIIEIDGNKLLSKKVISNPGHQPGFLPQFLKEQGVDYIIAGGMGPRAQDLFATAGITVILGVTGSIEAVIKQLLDGTLKGGESLCDHGEGHGSGKAECEYHGEKTHHIHDWERVQSETKTISSTKICITSKGDSLDSEVDPRFGRCQYFIIVDPETMKFEAIENPNLGATGGAGIQSAQLIASKCVEVVLTGDLGPNASQVFEVAGIRIITGINGLVRNAIEKYKNGDFN